MELISLRDIHAWTVETFTPHLSATSLGVSVLAPCVVAIGYIYLLICCWWRLYSYEGWRLTVLITSYLVCIKRKWVVQVVTKEKEGTPALASASNVPPLWLRLSLREVLGPQELQPGRNIELEARASGAVTPSTSYFPQYFRTHGSGPPMHLIRLIRIRIRHIRRATSGRHIVA